MAQKEGGNFLNLLQKEGGTLKGEGSLRKGGVPNPEETMSLDHNTNMDLWITQICYLMPGLIDLN